MTFMSLVRLGRIPRRSSCARLDPDREAMRSTSSAIRLTSFSSCSADAASQSLAAGPQHALMCVGCGSDPKHP